MANVGANVRVVTGWAPDGADLRYAEVVVTAVVAVLLGAGVLWIAARRAPAALRRWTLAAAGGAVASAVPLWRLDVDTGSKLALTIMHLATGACAVAGQHAPTRPAGDQGRVSPPAASSASRLSA